MTGLGPRMSGTISRLSQKYGATATITRRTGGTFDPILQVSTGGSTSSDTLKIVVEEYRSHEVDGDTIRYGDKKLTVPQSDLTNLLSVVPDDTIDVLGTAYRVIDAQGISSGDAIVGYSVQVRK